MNDDQTILWVWPNQLKCRPAATVTGVAELPVKVHTAGGSTAVVDPDLLRPSAAVLIGVG